MWRQRRYFPKSWTKWFKPKAIAEAHQPCEGGRRTNERRKSPQKDVVITQALKPKPICMEAAARLTASAAPLGDLAANGPPPSAPIPHPELKVNGRSLSDPTLRCPLTESASSQYETMVLDDQMEAHAAQYNTAPVWREVRPQLLELPLLAATEYLAQTSEPESLSIQYSKPCTSGVLRPVEDLIVPGQSLAYENKPSPSLYSGSARVVGPVISRHEMSNSREEASSKNTSVELQAEELDLEDFFGFPSRNHVLEPTQMPILSETGSESNLSEMKIPENVGLEELESYLMEAIAQNNCVYDTIPL